MQQHDQTPLAVFENLTDVVLVLDRDARIRWANSSVRRYGLTPDAYIGRSVTGQLPPDDAGRLIAGLAQATANPGRATPVQALTLLPLDGRALPAEAILLSLPDVAGINGVVAILRDAAPRDTLAARTYDGMSRKAAELPSKETEGESEEQLRQVVRLSHIGIFDHNHLTGRFYWSPEHRKIFGWGANEPVEFANPTGTGWRTWNLVHPADRVRASAAVRRAHAGDNDSLFDMEYRIVRRDGSMRWIATRSQTLFEGEGAARHPVRTVGAVQDITAQKQAERQLQLTQTSVDKCNTAIFWINVSGQVTYANDFACRSLGLAREELVGLHMWDFDPDFDPGAWPGLWDDVRRGKSAIIETRHRRKDGATFPVEAAGSYLRIDGEEHLFVFTQDTTERERAERERRLMHAAIDKSHTPFYSIGPMGEIIYANEHACLMLGLTREQLIGRHIWDIDPTMLRETQQEYWDAVKAKGVLSFETTHRRADGTTVPVEVTANFFSFKGEEFTLAFVRDITERKKADLALRASERRLREAQSIAHIGNWELDVATHRVFWSDEVFRLFDVDPAHFNGSYEAVLENIHPDDRARANSAYQESLKNGTPYRVTYRVLTQDGYVRHLEARCETDFAPDGTPILSRGTVQDVTQQVLAEEALKNSLHEKETLLREVHHRVKNNLQIIASLLQSSDLSRIDFGSYLQSLVRELQRSYSAPVQNVEVHVSGDTLALPIESALPCGMILCELITNIFKYAFPDGRRGQADISFTSSEGLIHLNVSDNGVGLPESFDPEHTTSFGWELIRNLTSQLGGTARVGRSGGTHVTISFANPPASP